MDFDELPRHLKRRYQKEFEETAIDYCHKYPNGAPKYLRTRNPLLAAIVDGDMDHYEALLDDLSDEDLIQEIIAPGTAKEVRPEEMSYFIPCY